MMARLIKLSGRRAAEQNTNAIVDDEDYEMIMAYGVWHLNDSGYAVRRDVIDGVKQTIRMHRVINQTPSDKVTDHINHNRADNRKHNLRTVTQPENMRNLANPGKGYWHQKQSDRWIVEINSKYIASFVTEEEAKSVAQLIRSGGTYVKPVKTHCKHGHSLEDAYHYDSGDKCRTCQSIQSKAYFKRTYIPNPKKIVTICSRGHDKRTTRTKNGDCKTCAVIRASKRNKRLTYANN